MNKEQRRAMFPDAIAMLEEFKPDAFVAHMKAGDYTYGEPGPQGVPVTTDHYALK